LLLLLLLPDALAQFLLQLLLCSKLCTYSRPAKPAAACLLLLRPHALAQSRP
jgi:hypothetical protein